MPTLNLIILYVEDPHASAAFYSTLLSLEPRAQSPGYASFEMGSGLTLGLLATTSTAIVQPASATGRKLPSW